MGTTELQQTFLAFREQCIWLQKCFNTYRALYESGEGTSAVLFHSAGNFFKDLNVILIEYCYSQICRLTDPPETKGRDNLTVKHISGLLWAEGKLSPQILEASQGIARYRSLIEEPRNRLIAHADKQAILSGLPLGGHDRAEVDAFFENLYCYVNEVGQAVGVGPLDFRGTAGPGDVINLIHVLKASLASKLGENHG